MTKVLAAKLTGLLAACLLVSCVANVRIGNKSGKYSLGCMPKGKLQRQLKPYDAEIEKRRSQIAQEWNQVTRLRFFLSYSSTHDGTPEKGQCKTLKPAQLPQKPPATACAPGDQMVPAKMCWFGEALSAIEAKNPKSLQGRSFSGKLLCSEIGKGRPLPPIFRDLPPAQAREWCEFYLKSEGIHSYADLAASGFLSYAIDAFPRADDGSTDFAKLLLYAMQKDVCLKRAAAYCKIRYDLFQVEQGFRGNPAALRQECLSWKSQLATAQQTVARLQGEVAEIRRESASIRAELQDLDRKLRADGIDCGD